MVGDEIEKVNKRSVTYHHWTDALEATHEFPCTISVWRLTAAKARLVAHACTHTNTGTGRAFALYSFGLYIIQFKWGAQVPAPHVDAYEPLMELTIIPLTKGRRASVRFSALWC
jgi:hypothetical protein